MTKQSFLELDSTYRNRNLDNKVSDFTVTVSQSGIRKQENALDPVSNAYPVSVFSFGIVPLISIFGNAFALESFDTSPNITNTSSATVLILKVTSGGPVITDSGALNGCVLVSRVATNDDEYRRILDWKYLNSKLSGGNVDNYYKVTVESMFNLPTQQTGGPLPASVDVSSAQPKKGQLFQIYNPTDFTDTTRPYLFLPSSLAIPNYYNKYIVYNQTNNSYVKILSYDMDTHLALLGDISGLGWTTNDIFVIRKEAPCQLITATGGSTTTITVSSLSSPPSFYVNAFVRSTSANNENSIRKITKAAGSALYVSVPFSSPVQNTDTFEILQYSYDNYSPFVYTGTTLNSQPVAYEICLNSLILPNVFLTNGGRIAYYPYVYVVLENVSSTSGNPRNMIYSNNPNNYKAVFRAPITDLNHPNNSPFVKLTGNGMKQTMVFKQNDDIHVSMLLPNGSLFEPITQDNPAGQMPNPLIQLSFVFSFEQIE